MGVLLATSTTLELAELEAAAALDPWGEHQEDWRVALLCSTIHNAACAKKEHLKGPDEFMKVLRPQPESEDEIDPRDDQLAAMLKSLTARLGGQINGDN